MPSRFTRAAFASLLSTFLIGAVGCQNDPPPGDQADLEALLRDRDLVLESQGALSLAPASSDGGLSGAAGSSPAGTGVGGTVGAAGTSGTMTGAAGGTCLTTGAAGAFPGDGGVTTGVGGGFGTGAAGSSISGAGGAIMTGAAGFPGKTGQAGFSGGPDGGCGVPPPPPGGPLGRWTFDDCNSFRADLQDTNFTGHTAFRSVGVQCATGISGQAVSIAKTEDIVYVPDQPDFTFDSGLTVAGWFNPTNIHQTRSLMRKRDQGTSDFALLLNNDKYQFIVNLGPGHAASVESPKKAQANTWTHVAGTFDGMWLRLYLDGAEVAAVKATGTITPGPGPLLMGNDGSERRLDGLMDTTFFENRAATADEVMALTCLHQPLTLAGTPATSDPTLPGTPATFDIAITNNNSASCPPESSVFFEPTGFIEGISVDPQFQFLPPIPSGTTAHVSMNVTGSDDPDPGTYTIPFFVEDESPDANFAETVGSVDFVLAASGCRVSRAKELMITSPTVVDDAVRTTGSGVWTFKHLMEAMAPTEADAPAMVEEMLTTFESDQTVNTFTIEARPQMKSLILDSWPRTPDGALDLTQAPFMLQAIVNRFDLRNLSNGDAGEGRFVFAFLAPGGVFPLQATMIFEYKLPASTDADVQGWADSWHALGGLTLGTEEYNAALEAITERFASRGKRPDHQNGSAINAVRTNEIDLGVNGRWQMREFGLDSMSGELAPTTIKLTPDLSFNGTDTLASFVNANAPAIIAETHTVPETFNGAPFATGSVFNDLIAWTSPGIADNEARFHFSLNTCNGCHSSAETGTTFLQISPRFGHGNEAGLSGFLTGITVPDPVTFQPRSFNDLGRRGADLKTIVCPGSPPPPPPGTSGGDGGAMSPPPPPPKTSLQKGISRAD